MCDVCGWTGHVKWFMVSYDVTSITRYIYQYNKANLNTLCDTLYITPWDICFCPEFNINDVWVNFKDLLFAVVKDVVPIRRQNCKKRNPWITNEIVTLSRKKHRAYNAARRNPTNNYLWTKYKSIRNKVKYLTAQSYANSRRTYLRTAHRLQNVSGHLLTVSVVREVLIASV